jgi:hypothetical protein
VHGDGATGGGVIHDRERVNGGFAGHRDIVGVGSRSRQVGIFTGC